MKRQIRFLTCMAAVLGVAFLFIACGGSGSGGGVTYDGSTDPAVADSTNAALLAEYGMGALEAGYPLAGPFVAPPPAIMLGALSAEPLVADYTTTVTIDVPPEAVYYGSDYDSKYGTGTAEIDGSLTLLLGNNIAADADTWFIVEAELDGSIYFDGFSPGDEAAVTGRVTVPYGLFTFSGDADFLLPAMEFSGNPGLPIWEELLMTFTDISVTDGVDSWSLGEGDWGMTIGLGSWVDLDIFSMTVGYEGETFKLEDTNLYAEFGEFTPLAVAQPALIMPIQYTDITISGIDYKAGTFYHPELGAIEFAGGLREEDPPAEIVDGSLVFYNTMGAVQYRIWFDYDPDNTNKYNPATYYRLDIDAGMYTERGYYIDGVFIPTDLAPIIVIVM